MAEGVFLRLTETQILSLETKARNLITEGKTQMTYTIGGRSSGKEFPMSPKEVLLECRYALRRINPTTYGHSSRRTYAKFR